MNYSNSTFLGIQPPNANQPTQPYSSQLAADFDLILVKELYDLINSMNSINELSFGDKYFNSYLRVVFQKFTITSICDDNYYIETLSKPKRVCGSDICVLDIYVQEQNSFSVDRIGSINLRIDMLYKCSDLVIIKTLHKLIPLLGPFNGFVI